MREELDDAEIERLLAEERARTGASADVIARIQSGARARIAALPPGFGGPPGDGGEPGAGGASGGDVGPSGATTGPGGSASASPTGNPAPPAGGEEAANLAELAARLLGPSKLAVWGLRLALFASGSLSGWAAHEAVDRATERAERSADVGDGSPVRARTNDASTTGAVDAPPASTVPEVAPSPEIPRALDVARDPLGARDDEASPARSERTRLDAGPAESRLATGDPALVEERLLLDGAQSALARGDAASAMRAVVAHQQRFTSGRLAEEREALAVRALARLGRILEAEARADAFRRRWPRSVLRSVVDHAVHASATEPSHEGD